jgi:hypothetical protein
MTWLLLILNGLNGSCQVIQLFFCVVFESSTHLAKWVMFVFRLTRSRVITGCNHVELPTGFATCYKSHTFDIIPKI